MLLDYELEEVEDCVVVVGVGEDDFAFPFRVEDVSVGFWDV